MTDTPIDVVRASRDGHQYHEAWMARRALGLLLARDGLRGIAVEGLWLEDEADISQPAIEIADATFYYGSPRQFKDATSVEIAQFKYSIAHASTDLRFFDFKKTFQKFEIAEADLAARHGTEATQSKLRYSLITNRPIAPALVEALKSLAAGTTPQTRDAQDQHEQILKAATLQGDQLRSFAFRMSLVGKAGHLQTLESGNAQIIADWSASHDVLARARLGDLRSLVRSKAGSSGQKDNLITTVDVLAALGVAHENELLPAPKAFPEIGPIVDRAQLSDFVAKIDQSPHWIVHAAGGIGKTVFAQSVASRLSAQDEVVLFDCFGGGAYRSIADGRHRPERGLLHIVNELACRGLSDLILPGSSDPSEVVRRSLERFTQAIEVLRRTKANARLIIIIDAADNAADEADRRNQLSFPRELLETLSLKSPVDGLIVIATARTERRNLAIGRASCAPFELTPFSIEETTAFVQARRPKATAMQIEAISRRSDGNPRVIDNLIEPGRSLTGESEELGKVDLTDLIKERLARAIGLANQKGAGDDAVHAFLCALSVLPPPVPIDEMAVAFGIASAEVESFAADLSPLLERTRHGIIFRDEPTETLVRSQYGSKLPLLDEVVTRLTHAQDTSVYAARALPGLLLAMGKVEDLRALAFDTRFPAELDSEVARHAVRLNRLRTALGAAAKAGSFDGAVDLLVELSSVVIVDQRGEDYLLSNPDLTIALSDPEALRRLFEARTTWPGERHARLAIAYTTDADTAEAYSHAVRLQDWLNWHYRQDQRTRMGISPTVDDHAAIPFFLIVRDRSTDAARTIARWNDQYAYQVARRSFELCRVAAALGNFSGIDAALESLVRCRTASGALIASALSEFPELDEASSTRLLRRLAAALPQGKALRDDFDERQKADSYCSALQRAAIRSAHFGLLAEATAIQKVIAPKRYTMWSLRDPFHADYIVPWALAVAIRAIAEDRTPTLIECLPEELWLLVQNDGVPTEDVAQQRLVEERLREKPAEAAKNDHGTAGGQLSSYERHHAPDWLRTRIVPLLELVRLVVVLLRATSEADRLNALDNYFCGWKSAQDNVKSDIYQFEDSRRFIDDLYTTCIFELLTALGIVNLGAAEQFSECLLKRQFLSAGTCIAFVRRFARVSECHAIAGQIAAKAIAAIKAESDVEQRSGLLAELARAILPASLAEAALIFRRGLKELSSIGSGDYKFTWELLSFAGSFQGQPLGQAAALRLAKICELNVYDSHKFPWPLTGRAMTRVWGTGYLAQICRWHDRDKVDLELTLPSALTYLVSDRLVSATDAVGLLGLIEPVEVWEWGWHNLMKAFLASGSTDMLDLINEILDQFERAYPLRIYRGTVKEIREVLETAPEVFAATKARIEMLETRASKPRQNDHSSSGQLNDPIFQEQRRLEESENESVADAAVAAADPLAVESIEELVAKLNELHGGLDLKSDAFDKLRLKVHYADRLKHLRAVVEARNLQLFAKLELLASAKAQWLADSPTHLQALDQVALRLVRDHAPELVGKEWGFSSDLRKLSELSAESLPKIGITLVDAAIARELPIDATTALSLATTLAKQADPGACGRALQRLLDSGAARLADEVGDGPWRQELDPGNDSSKVVAGMVWFCLGAPEASRRWRAAHAVRTFARLNRWSVIDQLVELLRNPAEARPFQDQRLPFFVFHAKLWLLLALARVALEHPTQMIRYRKQLEEIAFNESFPHVALREAARRTLLACIKPSKASALIRRLKNIHVSKFRPAKDQMGGGRMYWDRPKDMPEPQPPFHFEYDFQKYDLSNMGRMFGLPTWHVADACIKWIRQWEPTTEHMHDFAGRRDPDRRRGYSHETDERRHSYGGYLAWHALLLVGGQCLQERPVVQGTYDLYQWDQWLSKYSPTRQDGLWLADGTGKYPMPALNDLLASEREKRRVPISDASVLCALAGITDSAILGPHLTIEASWTSPDGVHVDISSALVPSDDADLAALAVVTAPPFHMWLPTLRAYDEGDTSPHGEVDMYPCEPWVTTQEAETKIDEYDPYGSKAAVTRPRLSQQVIDAFRLTTNDPWMKTWHQQDGNVAFQSTAWGVRRGAGERETSEQGSAIECNTTFLAGLLQKTNRRLLLLIRLHYFHERREYEYDGDKTSEGVTHAFAVAMVDEQLNVKLVQPSAAHCAAVARLAEHARFEFRQRFLSLEHISDRSAQQGSLTA